MSDNDDVVEYLTKRIKEHGGMIRQITNEEGTSPSHVVMADGFTTLVEVTEPGVTPSLAKREEFDRILKHGGLLVAVLATREDVDLLMEERYGWKRCIPWGLQHPHRYNWNEEVLI